MERKGQIDETGSSVLREYVAPKAAQSEAIPFAIEDFWDLASLSDEQIRWLDTDLFIFIYGNGFGDALQYVDGKPVAYDFFIKHNYTREEVRKELKSKFLWGDWQIKEQQGGNDIKLLLLFSPIRQNQQIVVMEMNTLGWKESYVTPCGKVNGLPVIAISFEPSCP